MPPHAGLVVYKPECQSFWFCQLRTTYRSRKQEISNKEFVMDLLLDIFGALFIGGLSGWLAVSS